MVYEVTTFDKKTFLVSEKEAQTLVLAKGNGDNKPILVNGGMIMTSAVASVLPKKEIKVKKVEFIALPPKSKTEIEIDRLESIHRKTREKMGWVGKLKNEDKHDEN